MPKPKLQLTEKEVEAIEHYIWQHVRASENGLAYKVWKKMFDFVNEEDPQPELFEI